MGFVSEALDDEEETDPPHQTAMDFATLAQSAASYLHDDRRVAETIQPLQLGATRDWKRAEPGLYNYAIVAMGPRLRYARGLIRDLKAIEERWNDEALDQTALRHIFPHEPPREEDSAKPSETQPRFSTHELAQTRFLSTSQRDAVRSSISAPVSVITGPPGTGKSEVVAAVLLNSSCAISPRFSLARIIRHSTRSCHG